ncbi:MAG: pyruvate ferredoxin oxidoreductase [gamma proteobacterium symbiont of Lucinoma myriamae]|nr:pyruvate ferredoxin oxidoreductase [gamma proteobacterium symbiont of Lucinoma myriamae]MCU7818553.1 pyruvate ferredoxin oxidoreductase [gamma proteobacterium symbiont of Lucinoma myriamae]MCU7832706.1 pyruvate ferredoxin oxidoreductase [gamma proteobacterium symbiont of Lucinoma myriamae]
MLHQISGSIAVANAIALCRPDVVPCYPITPQTHIVEHLSTLVKSGQLKNCAYENVESEFASMSFCIGASAAGARTYTATASQGLLYMMEAVYNASGLGLPIVMTLGNRAIGAPINIWNDHSDAMSVRDAGWIQLFVESNQQAVDVHIQAFKLAEALSLPVMVNMDGFILTHAITRVDMPEQELVDQFLPEFVPRQKLDTESPLSIGAMVGPDAFTEVRYIAHHKQKEALKIIEQQAEEFSEIFGRDSGGLVKSYHAEDADIVFIAMGSVVGTMQDLVSELREEGHSVGILSLRSFRPFPANAICNTLKKVKQVIVFEKSFAVGMGGILASEIHMATQRYADIQGVNISSVIGGLGGRTITKKSLRKIVENAQNGELDSEVFMDLEGSTVIRELKRQQDEQTSGPAAENILRDMGVVSASKTR